MSESLARLFTRCRQESQLHFFFTSILLPLSHSKMEAVAWISWYEQLSLMAVSVGD